MQLKSNKIEYGRVKEFQSFIFFFKVVIFFFRLVFYLIVGESLIVISFYLELSKRDNYGEFLLIGVIIGILQNFKD